MIHMYASLSVVPMKLSNAIPRYMDLKSEREFSVLHGNTDYSRTIHSATNPSSTNVNVNCLPPSADSLIHPIAWKKATWDLSISLSEDNTGAVANVLSTAVDPYIALRARPLDQILQNEELKINGNSFAVSRPSDYTNALCRFANSVDDKVNEYTLTPTQLDEFYSYNSAYLTTKDPFVPYGATQIGESRYAFSDIDYSEVLGYTLAQNANNVVRKLTFTVMEPIKVSPMYFQPYALTGIKNMQYSANFTNHERMICIKKALNAHVTINSITARLNKFELHFAYSTPKLLSNIPNSVVYPYHYVDYYSQDVSKDIVTDVAGDAQVGTVNFNAINLSGTPRKLIYWISEKNDQITGIRDTPKSLVQNLRKTDTAKAYITSTSITFANKQGILSEADDKDLFEISKKNGLLGMSYSQATKWIGTYNALNFGEEIPLPESLAPGCLAQPQLSFKVSFKRVPNILANDPNIEPTKFQLNVVILYKGACTIIKNSSAIKQLSVLSSDDVVESLQKDYEMVYPDKYQDNYFGGRISGGSLLSVLSSALPIARMIRGVVQKGAPLITYLLCIWQLGMKTRKDVTFSKTNFSNKMN